MRLQLQPADLGEIELRVRTAEAAVRGELVVSNPEVKQLSQNKIGDDCAMRLQNRGWT